MPLLECGLQVVAVGESGQLGNGLHCEVGLAQQSLDFLEAYAQQFVFRRSIQALFHSTFQGTARYV